MGKLDGKVCVITGASRGIGAEIAVEFAKEGGKIVAAAANLEFEAGAYPGSAVGMAAMCVFTAYVIPNVLIDGYDVVTNKPKAEPYRAPGAPNAAYAAE